MEWIETVPIPEVCKNCREEDCYQCDVAGERWVRSREDELRSSRKLMVRAVERLQRKIQAIDRELEAMRKK